MELCHGHDHTCHAQHNRTPILCRLRSDLGFYPETMNRNLEALNHVFRDAPSPWAIVSMVRHLPQGEVAEVDVWMRSEEKAAVEQREDI